MLQVDQPIVVFHRDKGSSTTNFFTKYLHESTQSTCPTAWTIGWGPALTRATDVGGYVTGTWDAGTVTVQGSGGMSAGIASTPYAIGYSESLRARHFLAAALGVPVRVALAA